MALHASWTLAYLGAHCAAARNLRFEIRSDRDRSRIVGPPSLTIHDGISLGLGKPNAAASEPAHSARRRG
jgi:hypothetical protein